MPQFFYNPPTPAASTTVTTKPALGFRASAVRIQSGINWVQVENLPIVNPTTAGFTWPLEVATATPSVMVTAPPTSTAPLGPIIPTQLIFTDEQISPNSGITTPGAPIAVVSMQQGNILGNKFDIFTGLARGLTIGIAATSANTLVDINAVVNGTPYGVYAAAPITAGIISHFSFGQGTSLSLKNDTVFITGFMSSQFTIINHHGAGTGPIDVEARLFY